MKETICENIIVNEVKNPGNEVHLYYDEPTGNYTGFGVSAYLVAHCVPMFPKYSEKCQMPVVIMNDKCIRKLKKKLEEIIHVNDEYYRFEAKNPVSETEYVRWAGEVRFLRRWLVRS